MKQVIRLLERGDKKKNSNIPSLLSLGRPPRPPLHLEESLPRKITSV